MKRKKTVMLASLGAHEVRNFALFSQSHHRPDQRVSLEPARVMTRVRAKRSRSTNGSEPMSSQAITTPRGHKDQTRCHHNQPRGPLTFQNQDSMVMSQPLYDTALPSQEQGHWESLATVRWLTLREIRLMNSILSDWRICKVRNLMTVMSRFRVMRCQRERTSMV